MQSARVGKRGAIVVPASLRKRFGIAEGSIVIAEEKDDGILSRPAIVVPVERYSSEREAEFLLSNAIDEADYREKLSESWVLTRTQLLTGDLLNWTGCFWTPTCCFLRRIGLVAPLWKLKNATLCRSRYALEEARINLDEEDQRTRLHKLSEVIHLVEAGQGALPRGISLPEKDVPILLPAIEVRATHLLTGAIRRFGSYFDKRIEGLRIMLPGEYLSLQIADV